MIAKKEYHNGGLISPILANVYLHYVLDLWFELYVKAKCKGKCYLVRYCDDYVACFQYENEARWFYKELKERLRKFSLELEETKTRIFPFGRNCKETEKFDFLGFTIYNTKTRKGFYRVGYKTSKKKSQVKKQNIKNFIKERMHIEPKELIRQLNRKLIGYYNYYGISFNTKWLQEIYFYTEGILQKWLSRRSQRGKITWERMRRILEYQLLVKPRITYSLW